MPGQPAGEPGDLHRLLPAQPGGQHATPQQASVIQQHLRTAVALLDWLTSRGLSLPTCRQSDLDDWLVGAQTRYRRDAGHFVRWARAQKLTNLQYSAVRWDDPGSIDTETRWQRAYGGHAANPDDELSTAFTTWITEVRFHPTVVAARISDWHRQATDALAQATRAQHGDPAQATYQLREAARSLRMVLIERWGERLGSMGREWTRFEHMADRHGERPLAARIAALAGADAPTAAQRATHAPPWLQERIDLCYAARVAIGEYVSPAENARDQLAAFTVHVTRHRPDLDGPWTGTPDPALNAHLTELCELVTKLR